MSGVEILMAASAAVGALGSLQQASAASSAANYNAKLNERNAKIAEAQARINEQRQRDQARKTIGSARAGYGAAGVSVEGSPLDILEESAFNAEMDALNIRYGGKLESQGYRDSAVLDRMQAKAARTEGFIGAGSSLLLGGGNIAKYRAGVY